MSGVEQSTQELALLATFKAELARFGRNFNDLKKLENSTRISSPAVVLCKLCTNLEELQEYGAAAYETLLPIMDAALKYFIRFGEESNYANLVKMDQMIQEYRKLLGGTIWCKRGLEKPLGYAGDYLMMHYIYEFADGFSVGEYTSLQGYIIDRWAVQYALDVKERTAYLANEVIQLSAGKGDCIVPDAFAIEKMLAGTAAAKEDVRICSIACGPFGEIEEFTKLAASGGHSTSPVCFTGLDVDSNALGFVKERYWEFDDANPGRSKGEGKPGAPVSVQLHKVNVVSASNPKKEPGLAIGGMRPQHLIYSVGLMDYLDDKYVIQIANWAYKLLRPGGKLILGNFAYEATNIVSAGTFHFLWYVLDWKLRYRTAEKMRALAAASDFGRAGGKISIEQATDGLQLYACMSKPLELSANQEMARPASRL